MLAIIAIISLIIICATIIIGMYIYYCAEKQVGIFTRPEYNARIYDLELSINSLKSHIEILSEEIYEIKNKNIENSFKKEETSCSSVMK